MTPLASLPSLALEPWRLPPVRCGREFCAQSLVDTKPRLDQNVAIPWACFQIRLIDLRG
jgi:hypothetical protein